MDLFNNPEPQVPERIRTLGFYQPYGSLMLHGKIETRWVAYRKKAPFPLGQYLFYTTKRPARWEQIVEWSDSNLNLINEVLDGEDTRNLNGYAIATGRLCEVRLLYREDEKQAFVKYVGELGMTSYRPNEQPEFTPWKTQWALVFEDVQRIEPFEWRHGKQGVGFVPEELLSSIKPIA